MSFSAFKFRLAHRAKRISQAWRLARGRLTQNDAQDLYEPITRIAGWRPLTILEDKDVLCRLQQLYGDLPCLEEYATQGAARVAYKWEDNVGAVHEATKWAVDVAQECAATDGVDLDSLAENTPMQMVA